MSGTDRARLYGHVKLSLLNYTDYPEYADRKVGVGACATSPGFLGSVLVNNSIQKTRIKFIKKGFCLTACYYQADDDVSRFKPLLLWQMCQ